MGNRLNALVAAALAGLFAAPAVASPPDPQVLLYNTEGNRLRRYDVDTIGSGLVEDVLEPSAADAPGVGRDSNGKICRFNDGTGRMIWGEDSYQPNPPAGFGFFEPDGSQIGKLTPTYPVYTSGQPEPKDCYIRKDGILFTTDVGQQGFGFNNGQLTMWFPPYDVFPGPPPPDPSAYPNNNLASTNFCKIDETIGTAGSVVIDDQDRVYVASSSGLVVYRYDGTWPTGLGVGQGCEDSDSVGTPMVDAGAITRVVLIPQTGLSTFSGLDWAPNGNLYASTVLEGKIYEYDVSTVPATLVRTIVDHAVPAGTLPTPYGNPQNIDVGPDGTIYYADLDLVGVLPNVGTGPNGKVWRVRFDNANNPLTPEIVRQNLGFPDGVAVFAGDLEASRKRTLAGGPLRQAFYPDSVITPANASGLSERWAFTAGGPITGGVVTADVDVPGEGSIRVAYFLSWDRYVYAVRVADGSLLWKIQTDAQPNATFPTATTVDVTDVDGQDVVFVGSGEVFYALDAADGSESWRFTVGTGCGTLGVGGPFPGYCDVATGDERNEIEGSAFVANGTVFVTMDVNDKAVGKGGMYGLDARTGYMRWFFDLESGQTCRPDPGDNISRYDPYHSEADLGLPAGFFATRAGCDHPRNPNGCGNIWSSPAVDFEREAFYIASSNCDIGGPSEPPGPTMPPYDEAIFSLTFEGDPVWVWRPRDVDNDDLAFGGVPNLFEIDLGGATHQVVGVGGKDGTYYVLDRDGTNEVTGLVEPYWQTQVVPGGDIGGIISTAAADEGARRIYLSTAAGDGVLNNPGAALPPQQPTLHALDMDDGSILWQNDAANGFTPPQNASFGPTSASPGVVYFTNTPGAFLRAHDAASGAELTTIDLVNASNTSMATVVDGLVLLGEGIGPSPITVGIPSDITALCVPGTSGCAACNDGQDNDGDGDVDYPADTGCTSAADLSELPECDDGLDNDHDGNADYPADAGCRNRLFRAREAPACSDGVDNDNDTFIDYPADTTCTAAWGESESTPPKAPVCGLLGIEAVLVAALARRGRRRFARRRGRAEAEQADGGSDDA